MPLRDDRRGRRATIFANVVSSPRFDTTSEKRIEPEGSPMNINGTLHRWWRRMTTRSAVRSVPSDHAVPHTFANLVSAHSIDAVKVEREHLDFLENPEVVEVIAPHAEPERPHRFEVGVDLFERRERIVPITRRRLRSRADPRAEPGRLDLLRELLRTGDDTERAAAIDEFAVHGLRNDLILALGDRLEPLAAKAALAITGSTRRGDVIDAIKPHVSEGRLAAILSLLVGLQI
jgi:hypothetical protein